MFVVFEGRLAPPSSSAAAAVSSRKLGSKCPLATAAWYYVSDSNGVWLLLATSPILAVGHSALLMASQVHCSVEVNQPAMT